MPKILTDRDIDYHCLNIVTDSTHYYQNLGWYFNTMYLTGCRHIELYELNRWTKINTKFYHCQTAKGGNIRVVSAQWLDPGFITLLDSDLSTCPIFRYHMMRTYCARFSIYPRCYIGNKELAVHVFRYNRIKILFQQLGNLKEVSNIMGEVDDKNTEIYVKGLIYNPD